jgi:transposase
MVKLAVVLHMTPAILLKIILFSYSKGITSSREIQWCCEHNIIFKALSCDSVPHFTTIAAFVSRHPLEIEHLFEQVLLVCEPQKHPPQANPGQRI